MIFKNVAAKIRIINVKGKGRYKICKKAIEANKFWSDLEVVALGKKKAPQSVYSILCGAQSCGVRVNYSLIIFRLVDPASVSI